MGRELVNIPPKITTTLQQAFPKPVNSQPTNKQAQNLTPVNLSNSALGARRIKNCLGLKKYFFLQRPLAILQCVSYTMLGLHSLFVLHALHKSGQMLADSYRKAKRSLRMLAIDASDTLNSKRRSQLDFLCEHFSSESPFRPLNVCGINFSSAASLGGLIFTYMIVLLQFKLGGDS